MKKQNHDGGANAPEESNTQINIKKKKKRRIIGFSVLGVLVALLIVTGVYIYQAIEAPESLFEASSINQQSLSQSMPENNNNALDNSNETATIRQQHIINVLLLGLDLDYKPYASDGGDYHTDAIIVLAINFDQNTVDMISLPRDTFTFVPGIKGIYKLNAAINCGGGKTDTGFAKVCEAASWMLGGIDVNYYYAFELDTVVKIGDLIGGVEFDVDMDYEGNSGAYYNKGLQHLDGTGIYDYMRARKHATGEKGDKGRMNRGKAMLKAIFKELKEKGMLTQIPALMATVNEGLYTNITTQQSIALANFAYTRIDMDNVGSYTMAGEIRSALGWNFWFIDQDYRQQMIKQIYGVDVPKQELVSYEYANWLGGYGFKTIRYLTTAVEVLEYFETMDEDSLNTVQQAVYLSLQDSYNNLQKAYELAAVTLEDDDTRQMNKAREDLRADTEALAASVDYPNKLLWSVKSAWYKDPCINEVDVDFN